MYYKVCLKSDESCEKSIILKYLLPNVPMLMKKKKMLKFKNGKFWIKNRMSGDMLDSYLSEKLALYIRLTVCK